MLKSTEYKKLLFYSNYESPNFKDCSEVRSADTQFHVTIKI